VIKCYIKIVPVAFILLLSAACNNSGEVKQERYYPKSPIGVVNINTATIEELMCLPLIDTHKAQLIIEWRTKHPFKRVEEIIYVPLIGEYTYLHLRKYLVVKGKTTLKHDVLLDDKKKKS
jgi:competence ComEA-like helix-hairpin-helix protein